MTRICQPVAKVRLVRRINVVGHFCPCNTPEVMAFEGVDRETHIEWPLFGEYRIMYCPHCGLKLPHTWESVNRDYVHMSTA